MPEKNTLAQQGVPVMLVAQPIEEDEINLIDLWHTLYKKKRLIAAITIATTLIGVAYALLATPIYHVEAKLSPPLAQDIAELKAFHFSISGNDDLSEKNVFERVSKSLQNIPMRRQFFKQYELSKQLTPNAKSQAELEAGFVSFDNALQISTDEDHPEIRTISWEGSNPEQLTEWINAFVAMTLQHVKKQSISDEKLNKEQRRLTVKQRLDGQLRIARQQRKDSIRQLKDALIIAKQLDVKENSLLSGTLDHRQKKVDVLLATQPLYMRGSKALQAELEILQARKDDSPYSPKIRSLQNQLKQLETLHINPEKIRVARIDKLAFVPQNPIKPQRKIIVLSALFGGLILGIFIAFISAATARSKQET